MTRDELKERISEKVKLYIDNWDRYDGNPQIRINPVTYDVELVNGSDLAEEIEDSDEAIENAAAAEGAATEEADDFQVTENPDFYPVKHLLMPTGDNRDIPDPHKISRIAGYFIKE